MKGTRGVWKNGQVLLSEPVDWVEGTPLSVEPAQEPTPGAPPGDLLGNDPASIARWLSWYETLEPLELNQDDLAAWKAARQERHDRERFEADARAGRLQSLFE